MGGWLGICTTVVASAAAYHVVILLNQLTEQRGAAQPPPNCSGASPTKKAKTPLSLFREATVQLHSLAVAPATAPLSREIVLQQLAQALHLTTTAMDTNPGAHNPGMSSTQLAAARGLHHLINSAYSSVEAMGLPGLQAHRRNLATGARLATVADGKPPPQRGVHPADVVGLQVQVEETERPVFVQHLTLMEAVANLQNVRGFLSGNTFELAGQALTAVHTWLNGDEAVYVESQDNAEGADDWPTTGANLLNTDPGDAEREALADLAQQKDFERQMAQQEEDHHATDDEAETVLLEDAPTRWRHPLRGADVAEHTTLAQSLCDSQVRADKEQKAELSHPLGQACSDRHNESNGGEQDPRLSTEDRRILADPESQKLHQLASRCMKIGLVLPSESCKGRILASGIAALLELFTMLSTASRKITKRERGMPGKTRFEVPVYPDTPEQLPDQVTSSTPAIPVS
ncbi:unnamed protein product [Symbiodinium sp. CCMP2592]|nr:unnamed protein product [Symbiodinium sp. CCMP2592]